MAETKRFPLTFEGVREANRARMPLFGHGDIEHGWNVMEWGCALAGEVGELCNILKKMLRNAPFDPDNEMLLYEAGDEIADVYIYLDLLSQKLRLNLEQRVASKFNKTSIIHEFPVIISNEE